MKALLSFYLNEDVFAESSAISIETSDIFPAASLADANRSTLIIIAICNNWLIEQFNIEQQMGNGNACSLSWLYFVSNNLQYRNRTKDKTLMVTMILAQRNATTRAHDIKKPVYLLPFFASLSEFGSNNNTHATHTSIIIYHQQK